MTRSRVASAAGALLLAWAALTVPAALAQTPSPSPSGSAVTASPSSSSPSPAAQTESLALLLAAEPATIDLGGETLLVVQVTNTGTATIAATTLSLVLPDELGLVSSFPDGRASGDSYAIDLGPLDPGESAVAQVTAAGLARVSGATVLASVTGESATAQDSTTVSVAEGGGATALTVSSRTRGVLAQVGSMVHYEVTVANEGDEDLEDVLVVDVAPHEVDVLSVDLVDEVEAVQIGESGGRHDIVWNVGSLPAGSAVTLPWDGRAVDAGDLRAVNSVRGLIGTTETTRSSSESYLAAEGPRDVENPHFEPIKERVVTFVDPPPPGPAAESAGTRPVVLPFTGVSISRILLAGVLLVFAGILISVGASLAPRASRKAIAAAILAGLVGAACVSGGDDDSLSGAANGATPRTFGTDDPRDDDTRVKGERIVRGENDDATAAPASAPPAATAPPTAPATATPPPPAAPVATAPPVVAAPATDVPAAPVRSVTVVKTELEDLPVETQASREGDNTVSFGWDEAAGGIISASSGTRFTRAAGSELLTDLSAGDGAIVNRLTLRNTQEATRLRVHGRLVHEVYDGSRLVARLRSAPFDLVLSPGGTVVARFSYLVPAGNYTVHAAFEAD